MRRSVLRKPRPVTVAPVATAAVGFNFRASAGAVVDAPNYGYFGGGTLPFQPVVNGASIVFRNFGTGGGTFDEAGTDARFRGRFTFGDGAGTGTGVMRFTLPAVGAYDITLVVGYPAGASPEQYVRLYDNTTLFKTVSNGPTSSILDANGAGFATEAAWISGQTALRRTFVSTTFEIQLDGDLDIGVYSSLSHVRITPVGV